MLRENSAQGRTAMSPKTMRKSDVHLPDILLVLTLLRPVVILLHLEVTLLLAILHLELTIQDILVVDSEA